MRSVIAILFVIAFATMAFGQDESCISRWQAATEAGIVYGVGFVNGEPTVEVDEATWSSLPFSTRVGMAETLNCATMPTGKMLVSIVFISHLTHKPLGRWAYGKLTVN